jgi:hypothetical protein
MSSQRPAQPATVRPPFDPEAYARESDSRITEAHTRTGAAPSDRPTAPPLVEPPSRVASASDVPVLAMSPEDLEWFELPAFSRSLLSHLDGRADVATIASRTNAKLAEVLSALDQLARDGVITWRD